ncbi:hypothetical protein C8Q77DRAFT_560630 [Trametes polyzona]|nr:hypothetical protein C8Q77DRAFT_560630 [Trametes polyzona]
MSDNQADQAASNSLGLDLAALKIKDSPDASETKPSADTKDPAPAEDSTKKATDGSSEQAQADAGDGKKESKEKKKPYVNPDRVKTGGAQRDKLSEEELAERMARIREQNEKIKQRRLDVQADEDEYKKMQAAERAKLAKQKKVQENIDKAREQNARRKMDKIQSREWDSGKPSRDQGKPKKEEGADDGEKKPAQTIGIRGAVRGGGRGNGRGGGRGRGRGGSVTSPPAKQTEVEAASVPAASWTETGADADADAAAAEEAAKWL